MAWEALLTPDRVCTDDERVRLVNQATFDTSISAVAVLNIKTCQELLDCLDIARRFHISVYPISTGKNWGYGSSVPTQNGCVLISLAGMNQIVAFDEQLAYATIEPGVTFRQLAKFLVENRSQLMPPLTGSTPDASIIGNILERGIGKGLYEDMAAHSCAYEIILGSGRIIQTGFSSIPGAIAAPLRANGIGISLQDLFQQSNLGIVTQMTILLETSPAWRQQIFCFIPDGTTLAAVIERIRPLRQRQKESVQIEFLNDYRFLSQLEQFPFEQADAAKALTRHWIKAHIGKLLRDSQWIGSITLWADREVSLQYRQQSFISALEGLVTGWQIELPSAGNLLVDEAFDSNHSLRSAYWRKRTVMPDSPNPDRDRCGVLWIAPLIPLRGEIVQTIVAQIEQTMLDQGFEPCLSLRMTDGRTLQIIAGIFYDRDVPDEDKRAMHCYAILSQSLQQQGIFPYRLGIQDMDVMNAIQPDYLDILRGLKALFDPHAILAPGRYLPDE